MANEAVQKSFMKKAIEIAGNYAEHGKNAGKAVGKVFSVGGATQKTLEQTSEILKDTKMHNRISKGIASRAGKAGKEEVVEKMVGAAEDIVGKHGDKVMKNLSGYTKGMDLDGHSKVIENRMKSVTDAMSQGGTKDKLKTLSDIGGKSDTFMRTAKNFYTGADFEGKGAQRAAGLVRGAATASGLAVGGRLLSGGGMAVDRHGNKDIAGIPFV